MERSYGSRSREMQDMPHDFKDNVALRIEKTRPPTSPQENKGGSGGSNRKGNSDFRSGGNGGYHKGNQRGYDQDYEPAQQDYKTHQGRGGGGGPKAGHKRDRAQAFPGQGSSGQGQNYGPQGNRLNEGWPERGQPGNRGNAPRRRRYGDDPRGFSSANSNKQNK